MGLQVQKSRPEHAGTTYFLSYESAFGGRGSVQVEVNWLMRVCLLPPKRLRKTIFNLSVEALVLTKEELMAGKMKAFLERGAGRDLFDLFLMAQGRLEVERRLWRKLSIAFFSTVNEKDLARQRGIKKKDLIDLRSFTIEQALKVDEVQIRQQLRGVVREEQLPIVAEMLKAVEPLVKEVLTW